MRFLVSQIICSSSLFMRSAPIHQTRRMLMQVHFALSLPFDSSFSTRIGVHSSFISICCDSIDAGSCC
eukprot:m.58466 g.58466  ORF g.58466 m.58466 type:complete len:68 (+) comp11691_c0_seq5:988-1191(+)